MRTYLRTFLVICIAITMIGCGKQEPSASINSDEVEIELGFVMEIELEDGIAFYEFHPLEEVVAPGFLTQIKESPLLGDYEDIHVIEAGLQPWLALKKDGNIYTGIFQYFKELQPSLPLNRLEELEPVAFELTKQEFPLSTDIIQVKVINPSEFEISMGLEHIIEYFDGQEWVELPFSPDWAIALPAFILQPGESKLFDIWLEAFVTDVFEFEAGLYRIRKTIFGGHDSNIEQGHDLVAEFSLVEGETTSLMKGVEMQVIPTNLSLGTKDIAVVILNPTEMELMTGTPFTVDFFDGEEWSSVPLKEGIGFTDIGIIINPLDSLSLNKDLSSFLIESPGLYRISKEVSAPDLIAPYVVMAEFYLE